MSVFWPASGEKGGRRSERTFCFGCVLKLPPLKDIQYAKEPYIGVVCPEPHGSIESIPVLTPLHACLQLFQTVSSHFGETNI